MSLAVDGEVTDRHPRNDGGFLSKGLSTQLVALLAIICISSFLYMLDGEDAAVADESMKDVLSKSSRPAVSPIDATPLTGQSNPTDSPTKLPTATISDNGTGTNTCSILCEQRTAKRNQKFGGDLLDRQDVVRLAKAAREDTFDKLRKLYGDYFDPIFIDSTREEGEPNRYHGMAGMSPDGPSRDRLKRKLKLKVLKMMNSIISTESNIHGCDCIRNRGDGAYAGSADEEREDDDDHEVPDYFETYVFANGGHSQAAGHGNKFSESYTAVFARDVRRVWESIGIEFIDRNYAMGTMRYAPERLSLETFGTDVDFLAWNYAMTDGKPFSTAHYVYRGALSPGRPAIAILDSNRAKDLKVFEDMGLSIFKHQLGGPPIAALPDGSPDGIPLTDSVVDAIPMCALNIKCNGRLEGKDVCFDGNMRWSCTQQMKEAGSDCICPNVGKRSSWHMEALEELADSTTTPLSELLNQLQDEEDLEYDEFRSNPLVDLVNGENDYADLGLPSDQLFESWFKGPSICRTSYLPSESRFLGITTDTNKTGGPATPGHETYDIGFTVLKIERDGTYQFVEEDKKPEPGVFSLLNNGAERAGFRNREEWDEECPDLVMPDYKDFFYAPLLNGKASLTFPDEKEKTYYGYDRSKFKGVLGLVLPLLAESACKTCHEHDLRLDDFTTGKVKITVNSKPVSNIRMVSKVAMILEGDGGNVFWEPSAENENYKIEFEVDADFAQYHLRLGTLILH
eukprot:scaffold368_cov125-Cylindrotheca_fusiformis.AAC.16